MPELICGDVFHRNSINMRPILISFRATKLARLLLSIFGWPNKKKLKEYLGIHFMVLIKRWCQDYQNLGLADVVLAHDRSLDVVQHTRAVVTGNKVPDKVVAVVCRRFKTDDDAVAGAGKLFKAGLQHLEAITVI